jgi:hypothetical protein
MEAARRGDLQETLRVAQYRFGEKAAVGEDAKGAAHRRGVGHDALICGGRVLPQTCQKVAGALEVRRRRERFRDDHRSRQLGDQRYRSPARTGPGATTLA